MNDENLKQVIDYSQGQREAAYMVLGDIVDVDVDFLSGKYGGDGGNVSKHVDGIKTLPATGGNFAFEFPPMDVCIEYKRSDGALDIGHVNVI